MTEYPMTPEQEQEMRAVANRMLLQQPQARVEIVAARLGMFVFKGGRLSDTVSFETHHRIAQEEIDRRNKPQPCTCSECRWERAQAHDTGGTFTDHNGYKFPEE